MEHKDLINPGWADTERLETPENHRCMTDWWVKVHTDVSVKSTVTEKN